MAACSNEGLAVKKIMFVTFVSAALLSAGGCVGKGPGGVGIGKGKAPPLVAVPAPAPAPIIRKG